MSIPKIQLFCLPYSGGKAQAFDDVKSLVIPDVEVHAIEYAGKGKRAKEPFFKDYNIFIEDVVNQINSKRITNVPYSLFGYSIGALFAYDIASKNLVFGELLHIFLGGCCSVDEHRFEKRLSELSDEEFWDEVIAMGGVRKEFLASRKFLKIFSKPLRADFHIGEQFVFSSSQAKPLCDATILYSEEDTTYHSVKRWNRVFEGSVDFELFEGDHFFAFKNFERTAYIINKRLKKYINECHCVTVTAREEQENRVH